MDIEKIQMPKEKAKAGVTKNYEPKLAIARGIVEEINQEIENASKTN